VFRKLFGDAWMHPKVNVERVWLQLPCHISGLLSSVATQMTFSSDPIFLEVHPPTFHLYRKSKTCILLKFLLTPGMLAARPVLVGSSELTLPVNFGNVSDTTS